AIRAQPGLDPEIRALALELARTWFIARKLNKASWDVVREPGHDPAAYRLALRRIEAACGDEPDYYQSLNTLGVAQYRIGPYREALATLTRSDTLEGGEPANLAFLALARQRLGQPEEARQLLARLRAVMKKTPSFETGPSEAASFLREAEALIELDPAFPADP